MSVDNSPKISLQLTRMFRNKLVIVSVVIIVILFGVGGYFMFGQKGSPAKAPVEQGKNIKKLSADDIGLVLASAKGGKALSMRITKLSGVASIEYELSYDAVETTDGETATVPKGVVGSPIQVKGDSEISRVLDLGTCSKNVCRYDKVKSDIKVVIRVNFANGETGAVETTIPLSFLQ